jgi:hypothetical protein
MTPSYFCLQAFSLQAPRFGRVTHTCGQYRVHGDVSSKQHLVIDSVIKLEYLLHAKRSLVITLGVVINSLANSNLLRNYRINALVRHRLRQNFVVDVHKWVL